MNELKTQLCTKADATLNPPCPTGTQPEGDAGDPLLPDGGVPASEPKLRLCDTAPTSCLPTELGLEGNINLGSLLASISPGTTGAVDFVIAANGNMIAAPNGAADSNGNTPNGITLGLLGGGLPSPQSSCVPMAPNPQPSGLTIPSVMMGDSVTGYGGSDAGADAGPDLGIAINSQFLNYFLGSAYNSGLLCLGITTEKFQELNTGLVSLIIPTMKTLTFEEKGAALAITTRPQKPPVLTLGGGTDLVKDPLLSVALPSFALDFYVWSEDRYVRGFTFTADLTIPINIQSSAAGIQPVLGTLAIANQVITNKILITDDPTQVATSLSGVLGSIVGSLLGSGIGPINLASALSSLGLTFTIPPGGDPDDQRDERRRARPELPRPLREPRHPGEPDSADRHPGEAHREDGAPGGDGRGRDEPRPRADAQRPLRFAGQRRADADRLGGRECRRANCTPAD